MLKDDSQSYFWCAFQSYEDKSIIIEYVVLTAQIIVFSVMIYGYIQAKKQNQLNYLSDVYKIIIAWLICTAYSFFLKTLTNIIAYFAYIQFSPKNSQNQQNQDQNINFTGLRVLSSLFLFLDVTTTFFLQMAMIYIPYIWIKNALQLLPQQNVKVEQRIAISKISIVLNITKKYLFFRNIYLLYFLAVCIAIIFTDGFQEFDAYITLVSLLQAVVIMVIYPIGTKTFSMIKQKLNLTQKQERSIFTQYLILLVCNVIRIIMNSVFYFSNLIHYTPDQYCFDDHSPAQTTFNCLFLIIGLLLMHIMPGAVILYVYWPHKKQSDLKSSLLISENRF